MPNLVPKKQLQDIPECRKSFTLRSADENKHPNFEWRGGREAQILLFSEVTLLEYNVSTILLSIVGTKSKLNLYALWGVLGATIPSRGWNPAGVLVVESASYHSPINTIWELHDQNEDQLQQMPPPSWSIHMVATRSNNKIE